MHACVYSPPKKPLSSCDVAIEVWVYCELGDTKSGDKLVEMNVVQKYFGSINKYASMYM